MVHALFEVAFVEQAQRRGMAWHQRRLDRRVFRTVLDEFGSLPIHGRERQRYCRLVIQDNPALAGSLCLFLLDPDAWDASALALQMRALPAKSRRRAAKGSSGSDVERALPEEPGDTDADPLVAAGGVASDEGDDETVERRGGIKPVRKRRIQQRLGTRKGPRPPGGKG